MWLHLEVQRAKAGGGGRRRQGARAAGKGARKAASAAAVAEAEDEDVDEEVLAAVAEELPKIHVALCVQLKARAALQLEVQRSVIAVSRQHAPRNAPHCKDVKCASAHASQNLSANITGICSGRAANALLACKALLAPELYHCSCMDRTDFNATCTFISMRALAVVFQPAHFRGVHTAKHTSKQCAPALHHVIFQFLT